MEKVSINNKQCKKIADIVRNLKYRKTYQQREYLSLKVPDEVQLRMFLFSWAICHQTHTLVNVKKNLKGWEYIEYVYTRLAKDDSEFLKPEYLVASRTAKITGRLRQLFSENDHCTLDRLEERAIFLKDIAEKLLKNFHGQASEIIQNSGGYLINNGNGFYELLNQFKAYKDPLKKKSTGIIKEMIDSRIIKQSEIKDWQNLIPIMDYHMQRVMLRIGCVEVNDPELKQKLTSKTKLDSDNEARQASVEAIKIIAKESDSPILAMDNLFWSFGRSCCQTVPKCQNGHCAKTPCTYTKVVFAGKHLKCPFETVCKGFSDNNYRQLWQPIVDTTAY